jgi:hypothetical protein
MKLFKIFLADWLPQALRVVKALFIESSFHEPSLRLLDLGESSNPVSIL